MHVHFPPPTGLGQAELFSFLFLLHGVTSVRDAGDIDRTATEPARRGVESLAFPGPRVFACGPFVDGPDAVWPNSLVARTAEEGEQAVERIADGGFDCVKAYDGLGPDALAGVRRAARRRGLAVIGHVPRRVSYADARLDDVQHLTGVGTAIGDLRPFPASLEGWRSLDDADLDAYVDAALAHDIANTPTLVSRERLMQLDRHAELREAPDAKLLPRLYRDVIWSPVEGTALERRLGPGDYALLRETFGRALTLVGKLHAAGARIFAGTDTMTSFVVPGAGLHRELRLLRRAGLSAEAALEAATRAPGAFLGLPGLGTLREGAPADLALFREDPTRDLAALDTLEAVVADGRLYPREILESQLARYREHAQGRLFDAISVALTRRALARLFDDGGEPDS